MEEATESVGFDSAPFCLLRHLPIPVTTNDTKMPHNNPICVPSETVKTAHRRKVQKSSRIDLHKTGRFPNSM
jgi:hypothetical protein